MELTDLTRLELAERLARKECSSREAVEASLARVDRLDGKLNAFVRVDAEGARAAADASDERRAKGETRGQLDGVPVALKDILCTEGVETTCASKILKGFVPPFDATVVAKLKAAGAVSLGKLNMDEFAMGSSNENSAFGPVHNPWDLARTAGGSSGGSAAAVAAREVPGTLGTDTGGSIRQPAAFSGCVGLKPTYGRVSRWGVVAFASSLDQVGPLTRTVRDAALVLEVIAGHDPRDATSLDAPVPAYSELVDGGVAGLKIGLPREFYEGALDAEVRAALERTIAALRDAGATFVEVSLPHTALALPAYYLIAPAEASSNLARYDGIRFGKVSGGPYRDLLDLYRRVRGAGFGPEVKRRIMLGSYALRAGYYDAYYKKAQQVRTLIRRDFDAAFQHVDLLLTPTTPTPAFRFGAKASPLEMYAGDIYTLACNLAGLPGLSVPCGLTTEGLPVGAQLLGRPLDEPTLLRAGAVVEATVGLGERRPGGLT